MVICTLIVTYLVGSINFMEKAQLEGKLLKEDSSNYLIDFSIDAKKHNYEGNYNKKLIKKEECIKE